MATIKSVKLHPYNTSADDCLLYPQTYKFIINYKTLSSTSTTYTFDDTKEISVTINGITEEEFADKIGGLVSTTELTTSLGDYLPKKSTTKVNTAYKELVWDDAGYLEMDGYANGDKLETYSRWGNFYFDIGNDGRYSEYRAEEMDFYSTNNTSHDTNFFSSINVVSKQVTSDTDSTLTNKSTSYWFCERNSLNANLYTFHNAMLKVGDFLDTSGNPIDVGGSTNRLIKESEITTFNNKQDKLVSGTNIKTINNISLLGTEPIFIYGFDLETSQYQQHGFYSLCEPTDTYSMQLGQYGFTIDNDDLSKNYITIDSDGITLPNSNETININNTTDGIVFRGDNNATLTSKLDAKQDKLSGTIGGTSESGGTYDLSENLQGIYLNNGTLTSGGYGFTRVQNGSNSSASIYYRFYTPNKLLNLSFGFNASNGEIAIKNSNGYIMHTTGTGNTYIDDWGSKGSTTQPIYFVGGQPYTCNLQNISQSLAYKVIASDTKISDIIPNNIQGVFLLLPYGYAWMLYKSKGKDIDVYPNYGTLEANNNVYDYRFYAAADENIKVVELHNLTSSTSTQPSISACAVYKLSDFMF